MVAIAVISRAIRNDAAAIAALRNAAADELTRRYGKGHWSGQVTERGVRRAVVRSLVLVSRRRGTIVGTLTLQTRKPWAIDVGYFTPVERPVYLVDMAVAPARQRRGVGRRLLKAAEGVARAEGFEAIRLDAYDAKAGAGQFYARCGYELRGRVTYHGNPLRYYELVLVGPRTDGKSRRTPGRRKAQRAGTERR